jgi:hypothetical protein
MKLNNKMILVLCGGILMFTGCKKQLDRQPTDTFSNTNAYQTLAHIQLGVNEAYNRYSAYANDMYINALLSDEAKIGVGNAGQGALTYRWQYGSDATSGGDVTGGWGAYYSMIDQINTVLEFLPKVSATAAEEPRRTELKGQLLALRAIAHFSLLEMYADRYDPAKLGVPYMTKSDVLARPKRNTIGEVMTGIEKDLTDAKTLLSATTTFTDTVMNQINLAGYQARVALYKGDYQAAITAATTVINSNVRPLASAANFPSIWTDANLTQEVLFRRRYATSSGIGSLWTTTGGLIYIAPSDKLIAALSNTSDVRKAVTIGGSASTGFYVNKFYTSSKGGRVVDIKAMRIAEMYLIRAEAFAKLATPNIAAGTADLNTLRTARITGYVNASFADAASLINAVLDERFKELAFEGFRWYDLKRTNQPIARLTSDANAAWQNLPANSPLWVLPIPRYELDANPNMVQNPGYQ